MAGSGNLFANVYDQAFQGKINWPSDALKMILLGPSATPNLGTWVHYSDVIGELSTAGGYTAGGTALLTPTHTVTLANSWATSWAGTTGYTVGQIVKPATPNGYLYQCVVAGTSGSAASVLNSGPTIQGNTVTDGGVTWTCLGESITQFSSAAPTWAAATISAGFGIIYDSTPGTASTDPLICLLNFGGTITSTAGSFTVTPNAYGWFFQIPQ